MEVRAFVFNCIIDIHVRLSFYRNSIPLTPHIAQIVVRPMAEFRWIFAYTKHMLTLHHQQIFYIVQRGHFTLLGGELERFKCGIR